MKKVLKGIDYVVMAVSAMSLLWHVYYVLVWLLAGLTGGQHWRIVAHFVGVGLEHCLMNGCWCACVLLIHVSRSSWLISRRMEKEP